MKYLILLNLLITNSWAQNGYGLAEDSDYDSARLGKFAFTSCPLKRAKSEGTDIGEPRSGQARVYYIKDNSCIAVNCNEDSVAFPASLNDFSTSNSVRIDIGFPIKKNKHVENEYYCNYEATGIKAFNTNKMENEMIKNMTETTAIENQPVSVDNRSRKWWHIKFPSIDDVKSIFPNGKKQ